MIQIFSALLYVMYIDILLNGLLLMLIFLFFYVQIDIKDWGDVKIIKKISLNFRSDDDRFLSHYLHQQG